MQLVITIEVDNDATQDPAEIARILYKAAQDFAYNPTISDTLRDINGNRVGTVEWHPSSVNHTGG